MLTRREFGAAVLTGAAVGGRSPLAFAQGSKQSLKVGGQFQASHPASMAMEEACAEIRKESNGQIDINFSPMLNWARMPRCCSRSARVCST
jgi:TRAP-type transport system periplasmic protein